VPALPPRDQPAGAARGARALLPGWLALDAPVGDAGAAARWPGGASAGLLSQLLYAGAQQSAPLAPGGPARLDGRRVPRLSAVAPDALIALEYASEAEARARARALPTPPMLPAPCPLRPPRPLSRSARKQARRRAALLLIHTWTPVCRAPRPSAPRAPRPAPLRPSAPRAPPPLRAPRPAPLRAPRPAPLRPSAPRAPLPETRPFAARPAAARRAPRRRSPCGAEWSVRAGQGRRNRAVRLLTAAEALAHLAALAIQALFRGVVTRRWCSPPRPPPPSCAPSPLPPAPRNP